jgi:hypothetical protein
LQSFIRNIHLYHVKSTAPKVKKLLSKYLEEYKRGKSIKQLAKEANYPPYLFCRFVVEQAANLGGKGKSGLTMAMRDPIGELGNLKIINKLFLASEDAAETKTM